MQTKDITEQICDVYAYAYGMSWKYRQGDMDKSAIIIYRPVSSGFSYAMHMTPRSSRGRAERLQHVQGGCPNAFTEEQSLNGYRHELVALTCRR